MTLPPPPIGAGHRDEDRLIAPAGRDNQ